MVIIVFTDQTDSNKLLLLFFQTKWIEETIQKYFRKYI